MEFMSSNESRVYWSSSSKENENCTDFGINGKVLILVVRVNKPSSELTYTLKPKNMVNY